MNCWIVQEKSSCSPRTRLQQEMQPERITLKEKLQSQIKLPAVFFSCYRKQVSGSPSSLPVCVSLTYTYWSFLLGNDIICVNKMLIISRFFFSGCFRKQVSDSPLIHTSPISLRRVFGLTTCLGMPRMLYLFKLNQKFKYHYNTLLGLELLSSIIQLRGISSVCYRFCLECISSLQLSSPRTSQERLTYEGT